MIARHIAQSARAVIATDFIVREHAKKNAWQVTKAKILQGRIDLLYAECAFLENENRTGERI